MFHRSKIKNQRVNGSFVEHLRKKYNISKIMSKEVMDVISDGHYLESIVLYPNRTHKLKDISKSLIIEEGESYITKKGYNTKVNVAFGDIYGEKGGKAMFMNITDADLSSYMGLERRIDITIDTLKYA